MRTVMAGITMAVACLAAVTAAPAPLVRREVSRAQLIPVACVMQWGGSPWDAQFRRDLSYEAVCGQTRYVGTWRLNGRTLRIHECVWSQVECPECWRTYEIDLDEELRSGHIRGGVEFRLEETPFRVTD